MIMTHKEIEQCYQTLHDILRDYAGKDKESERVRLLQELARKIGASTGRRRSGENIDRVGLVDNIHTALRTLTMIDMCKTATGGYKMATKASNAASKQFWIAAGIAFASAVGAWVAAFSN